MREQAVADALRGAYASPPPGRLHAAYHIAYSLVTRMRATVEQDLRSGHFAPPGDPAECQVYASLYRALQRPAPPPATGETQRLSSGPQGPRATGRCPERAAQETEMLSDTEQRFIQAFVQRERRERAVQARVARKTLRPHPSVSDHLRTPR